MDPLHQLSLASLGCAMMSNSLIYGFVTALSNWTAYRICLATLLQVISRLPSMIRVVMTMFVCTRPFPPFLGCHGEDGFLFTLPFLLAGKRVPSCTRQLVWQLLTMCVRLKFRDRHVGQLRLPLRPLSSSFWAFQLAEMDAYIACLNTLGIFHRAWQEFLVASYCPYLPGLCL